MQNEKIEFKNPDVAFNEAIAQGRLSTDPKKENYAGHYMYMGPTVDGLRDAFKHIMSRQYLPLIAVVFMTARFTMSLAGSSFELYQHPSPTAPVCVEYCQ